MLRALFSKRRSPFEKPLGVRKVRRLLRNWLLLFGVIIAFVDVIGEPLLRWEYQYRGTYEQKTILNATYYGIGGRLESSTGQHGEGCPLIVFVRPETPLWKQLAHQISSRIF